MQENFPGPTPISPSYRVLTGRSPQDRRLAMASNAADSLRSIAYSAAVAREWLTKDPSYFDLVIRWLGHIEVEATRAAGHVCPLMTGDDQ